MKFKRTLALLLASIFLITACGGGKEEVKEEPEVKEEKKDEPKEEAKEEKKEEVKEEEASRDIVIAVNNNFITLDTHDSRDALTNGALSNMYEGLMMTDDDLNVVPNLAKEVEISEDALTYTFHLHEGVKFHDGTDFNADAVRANIERVMDPDSGLRQSRTFADMTSLETPDDYTVVVTLGTPYMAFLSRLTAFYIISPKHLEEDLDVLAKEAVGTGRYMFKEWVEGDHLTMLKNPDHRHENDVQVDSITYKFVPENGSRVAMLETGEADIIYPMPNEMMAKIEGNDEVVTQTAPSTVCRYVTMNQNVKPFDDVRVRKALNHAIDKQAYIDIVKGGYGQPLNSCLSPVLPFFADHDPYEYDVELAKELLAEAGYPDGFEATIWGNTETETVKGMNFIHQQLGEIGVTIDVVPMEEGTLSDSVYNTTPDTTELQMWYVSWSATDPDNAVRSTFQSEMWPPNGANTNYYKNEGVDEAIANGNESTTFEDQYKYYKEAQDLIWEDAVWMFMGIDETIIGLRSHITGAKLGASGSGLDLRVIGVK